MAVKSVVFPYKGDNLLPPEGHDQLGAQVMAILEVILQDKENQGLPKKWLRNYQLGKGKHWRTKTKKVPLRKANLLHLFRQRTVNNLTDNNPTFNVRRVAGGEDPDDKIGKLERATQFWWQETEQQSIYESSVRNGETYGCCIEKMIFSQSHEWDIGDAETVIVDPFHFGFYPTRMSDPRELQTRQAVLHFYPKDVTELQQAHPDKADKIKADEKVVEDLGDTRLEGAYSKSAREGLSGILTTFNNVVKNMINFGGRESSPGTETLCVECWVKDYTKVKVPGIVEIDGEMQVVEDAAEEFKYPGNIRCVRVCSGGMVTLEDKGNPSINPEIEPDLAAQTYLFDKFPFSMENSVKDTSTAWGMDDFEQLEDLQIEFNKALSQWTMVKDKLARLKVINPSTSGVDNREFNTASGILSPSNPNHGIKYLEPPVGLLRDLLPSIELWKDLFFVVAGIFELDQAKEGGRDVIAYKAIAALLERAATMIRGKIRSYQRLLRERGRMYISMVQNYYTEERFITTEIDGEDVEENFVGTDLVMPVRFTVVSGSTLPQSKVQQREEAIKLFELRAIDGEGLLDAMEYPGRKSILKRMKAGVYGKLFQRMSAMGVPDEILQLLSEVANLEDKEFRRAYERGQIPQLPIGEGQQGPSPQEQGEMAKIKAEIDKAYAQIDEIKAKAMLTEEKTRTEIAEQEAKREGIKYDEAQQEIDRAKTVAMLRMDGLKQELTNLKNQLKMTKSSERKKERGKRGIKSDNK